MPLVGRVVGTALVIGAGALAVATVIAAPQILRASRPVVREVVRRGLALYDRARTAAAEFADDVEDIVAEVRSDTAHASADAESIKRQA